MSLKGKGVIILVEKQYEDLELWYPLLRLKEESAKVVVVGSGTAQVYSGKFGYPVAVDKNAEDISADDYHGLIIPGGYAPDHIRRYSSMVQLVRDMHDQRKLVAAICHGGSVLVSAGILKGKTVTGFFSIKDDLQNAGAKYMDAEVVEDGNLVTSRKPDDLPAFVQTIIEILKKVRGGI